MHVQLKNHDHQNCQHCLCKMTPISLEYFKVENFNLPKDLFVSSWIETFTLTVT